MQHDYKYLAKGKQPLSGWPGVWLLLTVIAIGELILWVSH